jgi:hypothetical protein
MENNQELINYIKKTLDLNISKEEIIQKLVSNGWSPEQINTAFFAIENSIPTPNQSPTIPPISPPSTTTTTNNQPIGSMFDTFIHILLFVSLYIGAISLGNVLYSLINHFLPPIYSNGRFGSLMSSGYVSNSMSTWYLSALIISIPLFSFVFLYINKKTKDFPALQQLKTRRFFTYLTLIITVLISIYKLITLLNSIFSGDLTVNAFSKFIVIIGISLSIFFYYFNEVGGDRQQNGEK